MARLVASELGEEEIEESRENYSYGANSVRDGISLGNQRVTRPIVAYPEILELKDLHCFLRLPGPYPVTKLLITLINRRNQALGFIERSVLEATKEIIAEGRQENNEVTSDSKLQGSEPVLKKTHPLVNYMD